MFDYSGPLRLGPRSVSPFADYTGPALFQPPTAITPSRIADYSGPLALKYTGPGHYIYDRLTDWSRWSGFAARGDTISLSPANMVSQLGVTDTVFHYRLAARQDLHNTPNNARDAIVLSVGGGEVILDATGANSTDSNGNPASTQSFGVLEPGGSLSDLTLIDESNQHVVCSMAGWLRWSTTSRKIWGYLQASTFGDGESANYCGWQDGDGGPEFRVIAGNFGTFIFDSHIPPSVFVDLSEGQFYQILVQLAVGSEAGWRVSYMRIFVNGNLLVEHRRSEQDDFLMGFASGLVSPPYFKPVLLGFSGYDSQFTDPNNEEFFARKLQDPWPYEMDEVFWARWQPIISTSVKPKFIATYHPDDGTYTFSQNPAWSEAANHTFNVARYDDPLIDPTTNFILLGPVEDTGFGSNTTVIDLRVLRSLFAPLEGQEVYVSARAADVVFTPNDATIPWSDWYEIASDNYVPISGAGSGNYVQVRLRVFPSNDASRSAAPEVRWLDFHAQSLATLPFNATLSGRIEVLHTGTITTDLFGRLALFHGFSFDLPGRIVTTGTFAANLQGRIAVMTRWNLPGRVFVMKSWPLPARIQVQSQPFSADLFGRVVVMSRWDLKGRIVLTNQFAGSLRGRILVQYWKLPGRITVTKNFTFTVPGRILIPPDVPSAPPNLIADVPDDQWTAQSMVHFTWDAPAIVKTSVAGYYYHVDHSPTTQADQSTWPQTAIRTATIDFQRSQPTEWHVVFPRRRIQSGRSHWTSIASARHVQQPAHRAGKLLLASQRSRYPPWHPTLAEYQSSTPAFYMERLSRFGWRSRHLSDPVRQEGGI
jgi:hypothetical protein